MKSALYYSYKSKKRVFKKVEKNKYFGLISIKAKFNACEIKNIAYHIINAK